MKVICKKKEYPSDEGVLTIDKEYLVLEIYFNDNDEVSYRIICDDSPTPTLISAKKFTILDNRLPSTWRAKYENEMFRIGPNKWLDDSLWQYSFWEEYCSDDDDNARYVFEEEVAIMEKESMTK
jgi:hypothetical protein